MKNCTPRTSPLNGAQKPVRVKPRQLSTAPLSEGEFWGIDMTHFSLCSGTGGLDLAAERAGFKSVAQCEIDEYASRVLAKNFSGVPNLHDIRTVTNQRLREFGIDPDEITVISAGFPCQPYSLAGKGRGDRDERDLWGEVTRVLGEVRPRWFVGENTPGLFSRENQRYFRRILDNLTALGYRVGWGIWGACDVGAPHKRERVFIVAHADGDRWRMFATKKQDTCKKMVEKGQNETSFGASCLHGDFSDAVFERGLDKSSAVITAERGKSPLYDVIELCGTVSDADCCGQQERRTQRVTPIQPSQIHSSLSYTCSERKAERRNGELRDSRQIEERGRDYGRRASFHVGGEWWEAEPDVGRVAYGFSARVDRLRCIGNAVVPAQAYPIFEAIAKFELKIAAQVN